MIKGIVEGIKGGGMNRDSSGGLDASYTISNSPGQHFSPLDTCINPLWPRIMHLVGPRE